MLKLQELPTAVSHILRDGLDDQILDSVGDQTCTDVSEAWTEFMYGTQRTSKAAKEEKEKERKKQRVKVHVLARNNSGQERVKISSRSDMIHFCLGRNEMLDT